ncbi:MAG: Gfo/Idh/MocA family oxidoreductase [Anderseniella sp.]|uniref:Gfo/Idh/MocA family protein n=1 Tax=Parasphingorhabdus sp. TaxID=2709688 RepID=UPI00327C3FC3
MSSEPGKSFRIAVAGAGLIGKRHVQAVNRYDAATVSAIVDPDPAAKKLAADTGCDWYASIDDMLDSCPPDGVVIATPNQMHVDNGLACVRAGVPVLVEKPIAHNAASATQLVDEAASLKVPVLVGHHRRHNPLIHAARQQIESGSIGDIVAVHAACWLYKPDAYFNVAWRTRQGAGPVFINLIHDIDLLRYLVGNVVSVQAAESAQARKHDVEDTAAIIIGFANGALGTIAVSDSIVAPWSWELTAAENPAYPETEETCYFIGGTRGSLEIPKGKIWSQNGERSWWRPISQTVYEADAGDPLDAQIEHFCRVIAGAEQPVVSGLEGLKSLKVIEAIKASARDGSRIDLA